MSRPRALRIKLPPHVHRVVSRGREYFSFHPFRGTKQAGQRIALPGCPQNSDGSLNPDWWARYHELAGVIADDRKPGTFAALIAAYKVSPEWAGMAQSTRSDWSRYLTFVESAWGAIRVDALLPRHVIEMRDVYADLPPAPPALLSKPLEDYSSRPAAANNLLRALSAMIVWSIPRGWRIDNPCQHVPKLAGGEAYAPWSWDDIELFRSVADNRFVEAQTLALLTGQRQGDVLSMLRSKISNGMIAVRQEKTDHELWIPIHRDLQAMLSTMEPTSVTILSNSAGVPWTKDGFKTSWQKQMADERLTSLRSKRLVFHGLRKSAVVFLLEAGCTDAEVASITGQSREMVEHYARQVNQRKLAAAAILKWESASSRG